MAEKKLGTKTFSVFDCDSHVVEPPECWDYVPAAQRNLAKAHMLRDLDRGVNCLNGEVQFTQAGSSNGSQAFNYGVTKEVIGSTPLHTQEWYDRIGAPMGAREPNARLKDMDALGIDQVMIFGTSSAMTLPFVKDPQMAAVLATAYNDWVDDYCSANRKRLFASAAIPLQDVELAIKELRRVAQKGFKVVNIRPILWQERYPTFPEYDPFWKELEESGLVLSMHSFLAGTPLTEGLARRMGGGPGAHNGLLSEEPHPLVYSPSQLVPNVTSIMGYGGMSSQNIGFIVEAMSWLTIVLMTGWLERYPRLKAAIMESNASWLPLVLEKAEGYLALGKYYREQAGQIIGDPEEVFARQCTIAFESDEDPVYRMWDLFEDVGIWSSDYPHWDGADAWEAIARMSKRGVPESAQAKLMGENARKLYGIDPVLVVTEEPAEFHAIKQPLFPARGLAHA